MVLQLIQFFFFFDNKIQLANKKNGQYTMHTSRDDGRQKSFSQ